MCQVEVWKSHFSWDLAIFIIGWMVWKIVEFMDSPLEEATPWVLNLVVPNKYSQFFGNLIDWFSSSETGNIWVHQFYSFK
jgi:hypothetical protein